MGTEGARGQREGQQRRTAERERERETGGGVGVGVEVVHFAQPVLHIPYLLSCFCNRFEYKYHSMIKLKKITDFLEQ